MERQKLNISEVDWTIDPHNYFKDVSSERLVQACGILPHFIHDRKDVVETALKRYRFPVNPFSGYEIYDNGTYQYPGDPALHPLMTCVAGGKEIFIYEHSWIAFRDLETKETIMYRMD